MILQKIISGGQSGSDVAGLIAAKQGGIPTGGWMPKGFITTDGPKPEYAKLYNIQEHPSPQYPPRTALNVKDSDGTLRFATNFNSAGELLTLTMIQQYKKPHIDIDPNDLFATPDKVAEWINNNDIKILNIAGNSERTAPGITKLAIEFLTEMFKLL